MTRLRGDVYMKRVFEVFGKTVQLEFDEKVFIKVNENLSMYPASKESPSIAIRIIQECDGEEWPYRSGGFLQNPSNHITYENGFGMRTGSTDVFFEKTEDQLEVEVRVKRGSYLKRMLRRMISMEFSSTEDNISQFLHEIVFIPFAFFFDSIMPIHASSFRTPSGKVDLIGGTGGVGKTSTELALCSKEGYAFVSDDFCIVDENGNVYPNLAYPKIYAYNTRDNKDLEKQLLRKESVLNKIHWFLGKKLRGEDKVRRKQSPSTLYKEYVSNKVKADNYFILVRTSDSKVIRAQKTTSKHANAFTLSILKNEYSAFHKQLIWHQYNSMLAGQQAIVDLDKVFSGWKRLGSHFFENTNNYIVEIPIRIEHQQLIEGIESVIEECG